MPPPQPVMLGPFRNLPGRDKGRARAQAPLPPAVRNLRCRLMQSHCCSLVQSLGRGLERSLFCGRQQTRFRDQQLHRMTGL